MKETNNISFDEFLSVFYLDYARNIPYGIRYGQQMFNTLHDVKPELANHIRGSELDPFHVPDGNLQIKILDYLEQHWEEYK